ncbi:MAG: hypothetical protein ACYSWP_16785 [Planctomycetota bacterium]|jgi:hypothetical protein
MTLETQDDNYWLINCYGRTTFDICRILSGLGGSRQFAYWFRAILINPGINSKNFIEQQNGVLSYGNSLDYGLTGIIYLV